MKTSNEFESTTLTLLSLLFFHICMASGNHQPPLTDRRRAIIIEKAALLEFKSSVSSDPNSVLSNWNMFTKACDFNGVQCDQWRIHVVRINLNRTLIVGTIAPVLANLTALRLLDLSENFLTGHIPPELSKLRRLKILDLSDNRLDGTIPESLSHLNDLGYFNIHGNLLIGSIPASIFINWTKLIVLDLSNNSLSGEIPMNVGITLPWLFTLNLYLNNLRGKIPSWLSNSSEISQLDVENNEFSGELPSEMIGKWNHIEVLHLSYTHFSSHNNNTDLDPFFNALSNCSILKELELAGIDLCGHLPRGVGLNISSLLVLNLDSNKIYGIIPPNIAKLRNLTLLNLSNNLIGGVIPEEISHLRHLQRFILSNNILGGAIPKKIGNMSSVGLLDLSNNRFTGEIPTTIAGILKIFLNLSNNQLHGPLPSELGKMDQVEEIDISSNKISGPLIPQLSQCVAVKLIDLSNNLLQGSIPKSIGDLHDLEILDLSCNFLSGEIPQSLNNCTSLKLLNLSYNDFSGLIPSTGIFNLFTDSSFLGNPHLYRNFGRKKGKWFHAKTFLIIVCVVSTVMASTITILFVIIIKRIRKKILNRREEEFGGVTLPALRLSYPRITYSELSEATRGFTEETLIGTGSYGSVYRGILKDETVVAVKVLRFQSGNSTKSFKRECEVLKRIRHRNLMRIITACSRPEFKALVLPFMSNGSLDAKLHSNNHHMDLEQRISILSDVAEGMAYLHHHSPVKVIHCDLKPSNVLLNEDMAALVSDFGISRLVMNMGAGVTTAGPDNASSSTANILCGSIGYIAPEYGFGSNTTTKGDVYSFGVLVLELLTRKRPTDEMFGGEINLQKWVKNHYREQSLETVIDSSLMRTARSKAAEMRRMWEVVISEVVEIGLLCTQENPLMRPTMLDAADDLDRLKRYLLGDTTATFASSMGMSSSTVGENII